MKFGELGKKPYEPDSRTLYLANFIRPTAFVPSSFDFDRYRKALPLGVWGNDRWQNSVIVAEAHQLLRLERIVQRQTITFNTADVITRYRALSGADTPGSKADQGLHVLDAMKNWKNFGWALPSRIGMKQYKIAAYGELQPNDVQQLRAACYTMHGIHIGLWLPRAAKEMSGHWYAPSGKGKEWRPGSWGGTLVYCKAYDPDGFEILAWGKKIWVSNEFVQHYADEAWAVVGSWNDWSVEQALDFKALRSRLAEISLV